MIIDVTEFDAAQRIVTLMERVFPEIYEGLYFSFLKRYMYCDRSRWSRDLCLYLTHVNGEWEDVGKGLALLLWDRFEKRISC